MVSLVRAGITNETTYAELADYLDLPSFADYMLINMYAANLDWPAHNFWLLGSVTNCIPFRFISWDAEGTFYGLTRILPTWMPERRACSTLSYGSILNFAGCLVIALTNYFSMAER